MTVRDSNIELLRIIAMFLVLVVHADFWALGAPTIEDFNSQPANAITRTLIEATSIVCVNVFVMISGWFGIKPSLRGFSNLIFQCAFFLFGIYIIMILIGRAEFTARGLLSCLCLVEPNWFIIAYVAMYILSPLMNAFLETATKRQVEIILISFYLFQTIWGWSSGAAKIIEFGYSCFSFVGLYLLARYLRVYGLNRFRHCILIFWTTVLLNTVAYYLHLRISYVPDIFNYVNPLVVVGAAAVLIWFNSLEIKKNSFINNIAKSCFAVFLVHTNPLIRITFFRDAIVNLYTQFNGIECIVCILFFIVVVFAIAILLDRVRLAIWSKFSHKIPDIRFSNIV